MLVVVQTGGAAVSEGNPCSNSASDVAGHPEKAQIAARHLVAVGVLLDPADINAGLYEVPAPQVCERVSELIDARRAVLRVVGLVTQTRIAGDGNEAQSEVARIPKTSQAVPTVLLMLWPMFS